MTDHRASKQAVWDEDTDGSRPTNPEITEADTAQAAASIEDLPTEAELDGAIDLLRVSIPPAEAEVAQATSGTMSPEAVDSVARFISDPGLVAQNSARELDAPSRSLAALELLDAPEYGAEPTDMRAPPQPPPTPGATRADVDLPSIMIAAGVTPRPDQTERTQAIPLTHPMANSIAPGGSAVSTPPRARRSSRWQVALGVAALLAIGAGTSLLQSRGEHHAASGLPGERDEDESARREEALKTPQPDQQALAAQQAAEAERLAQAAAAARAAEEVAADKAAADALAAEQASKNAEAEAAKSLALAKKGKSMRVAMGGVRMIDRQPGAEEDGKGIDRSKVIAAMNAMTEQLKQCVGDEHGVADVTLTVRSPGIVSHALVEGPFAGSPQGSCIARTLRTTKLPPFADPVTRIEYPFKL